MYRSVCGRIRPIIALLSVVLGLTACGGGSGGGTSPAPTPAPTPTPTTTTNSSLTTLVADQDFTAISTVLSADLSSTTGASSNVTTSLSGLDGQSAVSYAKSGASFSPSVQQSGVTFSQTFSSSNVVSASTTSSVRVYRVTRSDSTVDEFDLLIPGETNQKLSYVTYGQWNSPNGSSNDINFGTVVFGLQTPDADMPTTGSATYNGVTLGTLNVGTQLYNVGGQIQIVADFATGGITGATDLLSKQNLSSGGVSAWRALSFSGNITSGTNLFSGTAASTDSAVSGNFNGGFFGPITGGYPPEAGGGWQVSGGNETAIGGFVGKR